MRGKVDWIWVFLKPGGRLTRWPYFLASMLIFMIATLIVHRYILSYMQPITQEMLANDSITDLTRLILERTPGLTELVQFLLFAIFWPMMALALKRSWDMGAPPIAGVFLAALSMWGPVFLVLCLFPGTNGANRHGETRNAPPA